MIQRFTYVSLILAAFTLLMLSKADTVLVDRFRAQVVDAFAPILDLVTRPVDAMDRVIAEVQELGHLREENARLREENIRLLQWQSAARNLESENVSLRELSAYVPPTNATFVTGRVIGDQGGAFAHSLILNAGQRDGVKKGQAALTGDGLVGRVASVGHRSARILLITDLNSRIPVLVESTRTRAILAGDNQDRPRLMYLPNGATVSPGDRIITSGHAGALPPGVPVGIVSSVTDGLVQVQPFVDRHRLEYLRVVDLGLTGILPATLPQQEADAP
ncbi:Cell shape-determining protein MreC [Magnetospira sp. QH-2]|nr:Cell shape-determining protein MreC [Magnetospira sp. QH-2]